MRQSKYIFIAERLSDRILRGDYHVNGIPAERNLATEFDVSYLTARKAIQELLQNGIVSRMPNGRLEISKNVSEKQLHIALLALAWNSGETSSCHIALSQLSKKFNFIFRIVYYSHWDDPVIANTVKNFDATFILPPDQPAPVIEKIVSKLAETKKHFFIMNNDWTQFGVPSIMMFPPVFVQKMLDHLESLGHRKIDCLNVQRGLTVIPTRIAQWRIWMDSHGFEGKLYDEPTEASVEPIPAAYRIVDRLIRKGKFDCKALICMSESGAIGAMRAMCDHGIRPGRDVALCHTDSGTSSEYAVPSITSMEKVDEKTYLTTCIRWLQKEERNWAGPLLIQPQDVKVVVRQTTVPEIERRIRPERRKEAG